MSYAHITLPRLLLSLGLIVVAIVVSRRSRLGLERDLIWGAVRGAAQLIAIGYVLLLLFNHENPWWVLLLLAVMMSGRRACARRVPEVADAEVVRFERRSPEPALDARHPPADGVLELLQVDDRVAAHPVHPLHDGSAPRLSTSGEAPPPSSVDRARRTG